MKKIFVIVAIMSLIFSAACFAGGITVNTESAVHPTVEVVLIDLAGGYIDFTNSDGLNRAPLGEIAGQIPTVQELTAAVNAVLTEGE